MKTTCREWRPRHSAKKLISLLLSLVMLISITAGLDFSAYALASSGSCGDNVRYSFDFETGLLTISGSGTMYNYDNSSTSYHITENPFYNQANIKTVVVKKGVTSIGSCAFYNCSELTSITIPDSITSIGGSAFYGCDSLTKVNINSVEKWCAIYFYGENSNPLYYAHNLYVNDELITNLEIPTGVTKIAGSAFAGCTGLASVNIPVSVTSIGNYAFRDCTGLTSVTIPDSVTSIGGGAFLHCISLTSIKIPNSVIIFSVLAFSGCSRLTSIDIPNSVTIIGNYAFSGCSSLSSIDIPEGVTSIYDYAFTNCSGLTSIEIPNSVTSIGNYAFDYCTSLNSIDISNSLKVIGTCVFGHCTRLSSIRIPNSVTNIAALAFAGCSGLTSLSIPDSVKVISDVAFNNCSGLTSIIVDSENSVYDSRNNCNAIIKSDSNTLVVGCKNTVIPNTVTSIGSRAFYGCTGLISITIPNSVESIGWGAFYNCSALTSMDIPNSVTSIENSAFYGVGKINANCDNEAVKKYVSNNTDTNWGKTHINEMIDNAVEPSCTNTGLTEGKHCSACNEVLIKQETIDALGHNYEPVVTAPTCTEQGYTTHTCSRCGDSYVDDYTDELGHNYEPVVTAPTCTEQGYTTHTCIRCGDSYIDDYTDELGHNYEYVVTAPTCTEQGYTTHTCSRCGDIYIDDYTDELGHNYEPVVTAPTCTEQGYTTHTCTRCGDSYKDSFVTELGHNWTSWSIANAPYGCKNGLSMRICNTCNEIDYLVIPTVDTHSYIPTVTKNASCIEEGEIRYTCNICGDSYTEKTPKISHTAVKDSAVTPTCEKTGLTEGSHCTVCGEILVEQQMIPISDHTPETDEAVLPTCEKTGLTEGSHCSVCGKVITAQEVVKANGHSYEKVVTEPTCLSRGYTTYTCSVCGDSYRADYVAASDEHEYRSAVTTLPTCSELGVRTYTCTICGDKYVEDVEMLEHTPVKDKAVAATFTATGKTEGSHCKVCGKVLVAQKTVANLGAPTISGLTAQSKGFKVTWKSVANIDGYQIQYSTSSSFKSGNKTVTVSGYKSTSKTVKSLKAKKKYYVRIRAYKKINGKNVYSSWSKSKYVTTKK